MQAPARCPVFRPHALALASSLLLGACASLTPPGTPAAAAPPAVAAPAAAAPSTGVITQAQSAPGTNPGPAAAPGGATPPPAPGQPPAFATVIKDAKKTDGLFGVWQKDDKVWLELKPEDFDKPFFFSPKLTHGIGEGNFYGGRMFGRWGQFGRSYIVEFKRVNNQVRLIAVNTEFTASKGGPASRAVGASFSPSLLSSSSVASQPHPERKTILVDANPLLLGDLLGLGIELQRTYRQGYALDPRHTTISRTRAAADQVAFEVNAHYASSGIAQAQPGAVPPGAPVPTTPATLPDVRSMFIGIHYSLSKLPDVPMAARKADARVGYFASTAQDFSDDLCALAEAADHQPLAAREEGSRGGAVRTGEADHLLARQDHSRQVPRGDHEGHPGVERRLREDRLQERHGRQGPARRCGLRHPRCRRGLGALDHQRARDVRRHRSQPGRSPQRRDPRCRHQLREPLVAQPAQLQVADRQLRRRVGFADAAAGGNRRGRGGTPPRPRGLPPCRVRRRATGLRARPARGPRRPGSGQPRDRALRARLPDRHDDARGGPYAGPAPQLPLVEDLQGCAAVGSRVHGEERLGRIGHGVRADQPAATAASRVAHRSRPRSAPTTTGRSNTATSRLRRRPKRLPS